MQNYPNPFNPVTEISINIPELVSVSLLIYNSIGKRISVLLDNVRCRGYYTINWNAENEPSGIYYSVLSTGKMTISRKMVLIK